MVLSLSLKHVRVGVYKIGWHNYEEVDKFVILGLVCLTIFSDEELINFHKTLV